MKKKLVWGVLLVAVITVAVLGRGSIHAFMIQTPEFALLHEEPVILYGNSWCPYCEKTKSFLQRNDVPYYEYNIDVSSEGYRQYKQLNGLGTPVMLINNQVIRGYNPAAIQAALNSGTKGD